MLYSERYNNGITLRMYHLINPQDESTIFLFDKNENIVHNGEETVLPIYIGFYYDEEIQKLITDTVQNVFCFFPTKEDFETCYVCHAPFLLTDNRQNLKPNESVNDFLIGALAVAAMILMSYIRVQSDIIISVRNIASLESELNNLKLSNDEDYARAASSVDLDEVRRVAIGELGMRYAKEGQIINVSGEGSDYVRQLAQIQE